MTAVLIDSYPIITEWHGSANLEYRIYSSQNWISASNQFYGAGSPYDRTSRNVYQSAPVTVASNTVTLPAINLESTTDAGLNPGVTLILCLWDTVLHRLAYVISSSFTIPPTPAETTWPEIFEGANAPAAPTSLVASLVAVAEIDLTWTDNSGGTATTQIERKTGIGGSYAQIAQVAAGFAQPYRDTTATSRGTTYYYRVRANHFAAESAYSNEVNSTTPEAIFAPAVYASFQQLDGSTLPIAETLQSWQAPTSGFLTTTFGTVGNCAQPNASGAAASVIDCGAADGVIHLQIAPTSGVTSGMGFAFRWTTSDNFLIIAFTPTTWTVTDFHLATTVASGSMTETPVAGDWISLEMQGSNYTFKLNDAVQGTFSSSVNTSATKHGMYVNTGSIKLKHFFFSPEVPSSSGLILSSPAPRTLQAAGTDLVLSGEYSGSPTAIEARFNGDLWHTVVGSPAAGQFSSVHLAGAPNGLGWIEARFVNDHNVMARIPLIGEAANLIVCDGDSLTFGTQSTNGLNYPNDLWASLKSGGDTTWDMWNRGIPGETLDTMISNAPTNVDPLYSVNYVHKVVVIWGGTNDIELDADPAADPYGDVQTYGAARHTAGFIVVILNMLPRAAGDEARRITFNSDLTGDFNGVTGFANVWKPKVGVTYGDILVDLGGDSNIGAPGANTNLTYYNADQIHLINTGYSIVATYVKNALKALGYTT